MTNKTVSVRVGIGEATIEDSVIEYDTIDDLYIYLLSTVKAGDRVDFTGEIEGSEEILEDFFYVALVEESMAMLDEIATRHMEESFGEVHKEWTDYGHDWISMHKGHQATLSLIDSWSMERSFGGLALKFSITDSRGEEVFSHIPKNYTEDFWVPAGASLVGRMEMIDFGEDVL